MSMRVGVDIGGTFTDFALFEDGASRNHFAQDADQRR